MKVYLPAIEGHVPAQMVRAVRSFLEFCYLVRRSTIDEATLDKIEAAVKTFHAEREIFRTLNIRADFNLPRQHAIKHYRHLIQEFGAPNGVCSSITENKHIHAVKKPYRRSNKNKPLGQMIVTNQRLDKLAAARVYFETRAMLNGQVPPPPSASRPAEEEVDMEDTEQAAVGDAQDAEGMTSFADVKLAKTPARNYPKLVAPLSHYIQQPRLREYIRRFLYDQENPNSEVPGMEVDLDECPDVPATLSTKVFHSAAAIYHAPSDLSGVGGMHREIIRATPSWHRGPGRYDCVFMDKDSMQSGFRGLHVARVRLFFSFKWNGQTYPCALVEWFERPDDGDEPDEVTGMWEVVKDVDVNGRRAMSVTHVDTILRGAHLIPNYARMGRLMPKELQFHQTLDVFKRFYVNMYADHHANEIAF